jgi:hypothetical protein
MKEAPNLKFEALSMRDIKHRISRALSHETMIWSLWAENEPLVSVDLTVLRFEFTEKIEVYYREVNKLEIKPERSLYFYFAIDRTHYFGRLREIHEDVLVVDETIYALESRSGERLLATPHHQIYVYLRLPGEAQESNVIALSRVRDNKDTLKSFQEKNLKISDDLLGFRVIDLSADGLSFVANQEELDYFESLDDAPMSLTLMFNGESFYLKDVTYIYGTPFVNPRARKVAMHKIGLSFNPIDALTDKINSVVNTADRDPYECHVFENFILGRNEVFKI